MILLDAVVGLVMHHDTDRHIEVSSPNRSVSAIRRAATVPPKWRAFASCVLHRESGATLDRPQSGAGAVNTAGSSAAGRWQMLRPWQHGGAWNVQKRLERYGASHRQAKAVRVYLTRTPIHKWAGVWQDMAAFEALESTGWRHWANGDRCDRLAVTR